MKDVKNIEEQQLVKKDLQTIEKEILFYKNNIGESVFEIGKRLIEVQSRLTDKTFGEWLREKVNFSRSSAYNFIRVAKEFDLETVKLLGQSKVFELATLDKEDRKMFLNDTHVINGEEKTIEEMSVRELKKVIKEEFKQSTNKEEKKNKRKPISKSIENYLIARSKGHCEICGYGDLDMVDLLEKHRIIPIAEGGQDTLENLIMVCPNCHKIIHILRNKKEYRIKNNILKHLGWDAHNKIKQYIKIN